MTKITKIFTRTFLLVVLLMMTSLSWGQSIWTNTIDGTNPSETNPFTDGDVKNANITVSGIGMTGLQSNAGNNTYNAKNFPTSSNINTGSYFSFTLTPNTTYAINFASLVFSRQKSSTGPVTWAIRSSIDNYAANIGSTFTPGTSSGIETIDLSNTSFQNITSAVTFRIYGWDADTANGTGRISDFTFNGTVTGGTVITAPLATDASNITATGFTANWNTVTGATGYRLDVSTDSNFTSILEDYDGIAVSGLSQMVTSGILPGTAYYYRVRAEFSEQTSVNSNTISTILPCGAIALPVAAAQAFCISGTVSQLTAIGTSLKWYAAATGGEVLEATTILTTGNYYVSQTLNNCESARTEVAVTINMTTAPTAAPIAICQAGTVASLTATGENLKWYAAATGGEVLEATTVLTTGNYYVSQTLNNCESARTEVAVTINMTSAPSATPIAICQSGTVASLTATGENLKWYAAATGGDMLEATTILATGNYYVSQTLNNCESARTEVAVTINMTTAPTAAPIAICQAGTVASLTATGENLKWYAAATGGDMLEATTVLTTGNYYVSQTLNNCESTRTEVAVTLNMTTAPTASPIAICQAGTVANLTATGENLKWYAAATGGEVLEATTVLTTGNYYVSQTLNNCESTRTEVAVNIINLQTPDVAALQDFTAGQTIADLNPSGENVRWYAEASLTTVLPLTTLLTDESIYYVVQFEGTCTSDALSVTVNEVLSNNAFNIKGLKYYPNPVKDVLNISYTESLTSLTVYNSLGQTVISKNVNTLTTQLDMSSLSSGMYTVSVTSGGKYAIIKVIR